MYVDEALLAVAGAISTADPDGLLAAATIRATFDQLYDGQHSGRYKWSQLSKTERTHFGTLVEINLRRKFDSIIDDGVKLDYLIEGHEVDCKYSHSSAWMIPRECVGEIALVCTASDDEQTWSMGLVRAVECRLNLGANQDRKRTLNAVGRSDILWLQRDAQLPPNILLTLPSREVDHIFDGSSGNERVSRLMRAAENRRIGRGVVATVAQQEDYMKRLRANGGVRTELRNEGFLIIGGNFRSHRRVARELGAQVPARGETVGVRVVQWSSEDPEPHTGIDWRRWRLRRPKEVVTEVAPELPQIKGDTLPDLYYPFG